MPDPLPLTNGQLSEIQKTQYWENGFLFPLQIMSADEAASLRTELEQIEAEWLDRDLPLPLNTYKRTNSQCVLPLAHRIGEDSRILDAVEGILGSDIMLYSVEFFIKEAHTKQLITMHQDLTYWGLGEIDGLTTAWLALSPATPASGCMDFVSGSHKNSILPHADTFDDNNLLSRGQEVQVDVAPKDRIAIELQPGQMSLHHGLTIHGSGPNGSGDRRIGAVVRYLTPEIAKQVGNKDYAMVARGADRIGNFINYAPPSQPFSPQSLVLYDEIRAAQAKALMQGADQSKGRDI